MEQLLTPHQCQYVAWLLTRRAAGDSIESLATTLASAFGVRLRRFREAKKLTLQQVADAVGCTKAYIWELEMKEGQRPSAERVQALAKVLGVTMEDIMGEPMPQVPEASPEDVAFFRAYAGMTEAEKDRVRQALKIIFPDKDLPETKR